MEEGVEKRVEERGNNIYKQGPQRESERALDT